MIRSMKKRVITIASVLIVVVAVAAVCMSLSRPAASPSSVYYSVPYAQAKRMPVTGKCVAEKTTHTISASQRSTIEQMAMSHLYDVPAGTNVDIHIATYADDTVTGSDHYPDKYGSYNFTLGKQKNGDWMFTAFTRCS